MAVTTTFTLEVIEVLDPDFTQTGSDATSLSGGSVIVAGNDGSHVDVSGFEADGDEYEASIIVSGNGPAVSQLSNGNVVVATDAGTQASFRIIGATGGTVVEDTLADISFNDVSNVDVAGGVGGGRFVIVTQALYTDPDNDIRVLIYDNDGTSFSSFSIDTSGATDVTPSVAALSDGAFAVAWSRVDPNTAASTLWYAVYEADGTTRKAAALHDPFGSINAAPTVVALGTGFAIAYEDNGWSGSDTDITLARFNSAGSFLDDDDVSQTATNESAAAITVLSNGMVLIGSIRDGGASLEPVWSLVDQNTGLLLTSSTAGATANNDTDPAVAAMALGQVATFFSNDASDVIGNSLQGVRTAIGDAANDTITGDDLRDVLSGGGGNDVISGGANNDTLSGGSGNDELQGGAGSDRLDGGTGADAMAGGDGNDVYLVDDTADSVVELTAEGIDQVNVGRSYTLGANVENLALTGTGDFTGGGNTEDNRLTGNSGHNRLVGGIGNDTLIGGQGNDELVGSGGIDTASYEGLASRVTIDLAIVGFQNTLAAGMDSFSLVENVRGTGFNDQLYGDVQNNLLVGNAGNDDLRGRGGRDELVGGTGNDSLLGEAGNDLLNGGDGNDDLSGGTESDRLFGEAGVDTLDGGAGADTLDGGTGNDTLLGQAGRDVLRGGTGNDLLDGGADGDSLFGDAGVDELRGGAGDDRLEGGADADVLIGGLGRDTYRGGTGADRFVFNTTAESPASARDTILDFEGAGIAGGDVIVLTNIDAIVGGGDDMFSIVGAFSGSAGQLTLTVTGTSTLIRGDTTGDGVADFAILVSNVTGLTNADFEL